MTFFDFFAINQFSIAMKTYDDIVCLFASDRGMKIINGISYSAAANTALE